MENKNLKIKRSKGRPAYVPDLHQLQKLYSQVADKRITNEQGWRIAHCGKTKWYELKRKYNKLEAKI